MTHTTLRRTALAALLLSPAAALPLVPAAALAGTGATELAWTADAVHSRAEFLVSHLVVSKVWGHIGIASIALSTTPEGTPTAIEAVLSPEHLDTDNHERDTDLRGPTYFDVARYPTMTYRSRSCARAGRTGFTCAGDLTLHGITRPVELAGTMEGRVPDPAGERVGYVAKTTIDRRRFGIDDARLNPAGIPLVGTDVEITLTVEATRPK